MKNEMIKLDAPPRARDRATRPMQTPKTMTIPDFLAAGLVVVCLVLLIPASANALAVIVPGVPVDAFMTAAPTTIDLPPVPADFFGPGSDPFIGEIDFPLQGHPSPDRFGVPNPFPQDQPNLDLTWDDRLGNTVSADSQHNVPSNVKVIDATDPYNFDTVVRRIDSATFSLPNDFQTVDIEITWLSLESVDPVTITFDGGTSFKTYDVYVGLGATPQVSGRMGMLAQAVGAGTVSGLLDLGSMGSPVDTAFEGGNFNAFDDIPTALGLPVFYQLLFENTANSTEFYVFDDPSGIFFGMRTIGVFHDQNEIGPGGEFSYTPEPATLTLLLFGLASVVGKKFGRRQGAVSR